MDDSTRPHWRTAGVIILSLAAVLGLGCDGDTPTSPSDDDDAPGIAEPSITEEFADVVPVGGARFYSFGVGANGTVDVTLASVGGPSVPSTVWLGLAIGTPSGEDCTSTNAVNTAAGSTAQLTGTYAAGTYCVRVYDIGNLYAPASVVVTIAHP